MRRYALAVIIGIVLGGLVHLVTVFAMPRLAQEDAYARLARLGSVNEVHLVPDPTPFFAVLPKLDPAFTHAVCLYDLSDNAVQLRVPLMPEYTSASFYTRHGLAYYALTDRAGGEQAIDLQLMTAAQRAALPEDEEITAADRLIVESPSNEGIIFIRAFVRERGLREPTIARLKGATCEPLR